jgi:phosphate transport system permease protein
VALSEIAAEGSGETLISAFQESATRRLPRRRVTNRIATRVVYLGGLTILISVLAIVIVIAAEVLPLFKSPTLTKASSIETGKEADALLALTDEYQQSVFVLSSSGILSGMSTVDGSSAGDSKSLLASDEEHAPLSFVSATIPNNQGKAIALAEDGSVVPFSVEFAVGFENERRTVKPVFEIGHQRDLSENSEILPTLAKKDPRKSFRKIAFAATQKRELVAILLGDTILLEETSIKRSLMGGEKRKVNTTRLPLPEETVPSQLVLSEDGRSLVVGGESGEILFIDTTSVQTSSIQAQLQGIASPVRVLGFVLGDQTLVVGSDSGHITSMRLRRESSERLRLLHEFKRHESAPVAFSASRRNKAFTTVSKTGEIFIHYATSGETQIVSALDLQTGVLPRYVQIAPKGNGLLVLDSSGKASRYQINNPHPEVSISTLFSPIQYEGYENPEYVWQSSGATDDAEPKISVIPLIFGTLKGTLYALMFAVPLAVMAAFYASQFMGSRIRGVVKPLIEIMAALPSVVIGFVAGLWLAPALSPYLPGVLLLPPICVLTICMTWLIYRGIKNRFPLFSVKGFEAFVLIPVLILAGTISFGLGHIIEAVVCGGDYASWMFEKFNTTVDQRNSIIAGIAVGFSVVPIIFTLAEDALTSVPKHLVAGSLALGATMWQTACRVVLPVAIPGIFAAVMIGLGRAVGETMIVLMATGNTPLLDWSVFNGFRAMSANIAVELPEAPHGGSLYRVLFLTAMILFCMTFVLNTASELVKAHFRKKFKYL